MEVSGVYFKALLRIAVLMLTLTHGESFLGPQVSLQRLSSTGSWIHYCGGALVTSSKILTAAHCVQAFDVTKIIVVAGRRDLKKKEKTEQVRTVAKALYHPNWNLATIDWDYGILIVAKPFKFDGEIKAIPFHNVPWDWDHNETGGERSQKCWITGWQISGRIKAEPIQDFQSGRAVIVEHELVLWEMCAEIYGRIFWRLTERVVCANPVEVGLHICNGFSGGALICDSGGSNASNSNWYLIGIASFTMMPCGRAGFPNGFSNVSLVADWILNA